MAQDMYQTDQQDEWWRTQPVPQTAAPAVAAPKADLLGKAKSIYGSKWDADAQQQFDYRTSLGQADDAILANTQDDYTRRFASVGGGTSSAPQTPTQSWNAQPAAAPAPNPMQGELYRMLMERAQQGTAVSRTDQSIRSQVDPVVAQQERASRNYLDDIAEKAGPLANLTGERRMAAERIGQSAGAFESEIIGREIAARRDEIQQSLTQLGSMLSADQRLALEKELAYLNDAARTADRGVQSRSLDLQNDQFLRELALREWNDRNTWDYKWSGL